MTQKFMGLDLWVYTASAKPYTARNGYSIPTGNVSVILGSKKHFKTWASRAAGKLNLCWRETRWASYTADAETLVNDPNKFLDELIGTHDKRTKKYKEFEAQVAEYSAWVMQKLMTEE